jgi:hypothetical protein
MYTMGRTAPKIILYVMREWKYDKYIICSGSCDIQGSTAPAAWKAEPNLDVHQLTYTLEPNLYISQSTRPFRNNILSTINP